jgi:hypothetical protein
LLVTAFDKQTLLQGGIQQYSPPDWHTAFVSVEIFTDLLDVGRMLPEAGKMLEDDEGKFFQ